MAHGRDPDEEGTNEISGGRAQSSWEGEHAAERDLRKTWVSGGGREGKARSGRRLAKLLLILLIYGPPEIDETNKIPPLLVCATIWCCTYKESVSPDYGFDRAAPNQ